MTDPGTALIDAALSQPSLATAFLTTAGTAGDRVALRQHGSDSVLTYQDWLERARAVAGGLGELGVRKGDRVALLLSSRFEFHVVDVGAMLLGAASFSLYNTAPVDQLEYYAENADPKVLIAEARYLDHARELVRRRPGLRLVVLDAEPSGDELSLAELAASCPDTFDVAAGAATVRGDDLLTLVYTSGTTGAPKGVQYVHSGALFALGALRARLGVSPHGRNVSYLPMAHIAERLLGHYAGFVFGYEIMPLDDGGQLLPAVRELRPTRFFGVPRTFEKVELAMHDLIARSDAEHAEALRAAWDAGLLRVRAEQAGGTPAPVSAEHAELLRELREATGLDQAEWLGAAGAPVARDLAERFHAVGLPMNELWGMSESIIGSTSPPDAIRLGTAGKPFDGYEMRLADDGELLVRSPSVTPGYYRDPQRTREAIDADGWLHTGDLGAFDADGYLTVVGRKKEIIINSAGKNMSPILIEQAIRGADPLVAFCVCFGDARPYNVALIVLDEQGGRAFAAAEGLGELDAVALARHPRVREHVSGLVAAGNAQLSRVEQIKRWEIVPATWAPGSDELTLTNKLRRKVITEKYAADVDRIYAAPRDASPEATHVAR